MTEKELKMWKDHNTAEKALIVIFFIGIILSFFTEHPASMLVGWTIICAIQFGILRFLIFIRNRL